jgi:hypothetical protein
MRLESVASIGSRISAIIVVVISTAALPWGSVRLFQDDIM